jgi:hypothetical protein
MNNVHVILRHNLRIVLPENLCNHNFNVYCTIPGTISKRSYSGRQVPLAFTIRGSPLAARGGTNGREMAAR